MISAQRTYSKLFPPTGYRSPLLSYPVLLVLMVAEMAYVAHCTLGLPPGMDARSYLAAVDEIAAGRLDYLRTPVYPAILLVLRAVFGAARLAAANCLTQCAVLVVSAYYFRLVALKYSDGNRRFAFWTTAAFYLVPATSCWTAMFMTETWAVAGFVFMLWWSVRDMPGEMSVRSALTAGFWLAFLVFLRPIFICFIPVLAVYWTVVWRCRLRRGGRASLAGVLCAVALGAAGYTAAMHARFGIHAFSGISIPNNYCLVSESGAIGPEHTSNAALADTITAIYARADTLVESPLMMCVHGEPYPCEHFTAAEIEAAISEAMSDRPGMVAAHQLHKLMWQIPLEPMLDYTGLPRLGSLERAFYPSMPVYQVFLLTLPVWLLVLRRRRGVNAPMTWLMWLLCVAMSVASVLGAMSDWARLVLPVMPAGFLLAGKALSQLRHRPAPADQFR